MLLKSVFGTGEQEVPITLSSFMSTAVSLSGMKSILVSFVKILAFIVFFKSKHVFSCWCLKKANHKTTPGVLEALSVCAGFAAVASCSQFPDLLLLFQSNAWGGGGCPVSISSTEAEKALLGACCLPAAVQELLIPLGKGVSWASDPKRV